MTASAPGDQVFSFSDPIPSGRLAIEASAGTGKTFTLAGLATRFIAESDVPVSELLIVTFTRAATNELRSRVRQRLVDTAAHLTAPTTTDELASHLLAHPDPLHLPRIRKAISDFDSATITTIHGFATQVLGTLGTMSGVDPDATLVDDTDDLTSQVCADLIVTKAVGGMSPDWLPSESKLVSATSRILRTPGILTVPDADDESIDIRSRMITQLAGEAAEEIVRRRRNTGTMSFDDILVRLRSALAGPAAASVAAALRKRFRVALIDEFQDTDPVQWDIFRILFGQPDSDTSLVLVGDPKQAIYSFRGADIDTYLDAVDPDGELEVTHRSLATNWRSDGAMLRAIETLLNGSTFGHDSIRFVPVDAAPGHEDLRIRRSDEQPIPALSIRLAVGPDIRRTAKSGEIQADAARDAIHDDLVTQVSQLLATATIPGDDESPRTVSPSDIAVLVLSRRNAEEVRQRLVDHGIPAVLARGSSVLHSEAATQWRWILHAMARPADPARARAFALSWFCGHDIDCLRDSSDQQIGELQELLHKWSQTLLERGLTSAVRQIRRDTHVNARVLARPDGDRDITDLDHVAELLQLAHAEGSTNASALLASLDSEPDTSADTDIDGDIASRRVESEAAAVQILTVWVAKGLEYPIVCIPNIWSPRRSSLDTLVFHDPETGHRTFDTASTLGGKWHDPPRAWPDRSATDQRRTIATAEATAEDLRLLYVALTRARHHTILWWSHRSGTNKTAISKVLFGRTDGVIDAALFDAQQVALPDDDNVITTLQPLVDRARGAISVGVHGSASPVMSARDSRGAAQNRHDLQLARLDHTPDRRRHRWSFSAIANRVEHRPNPLDESMSDSGASDEPADPTDVPWTTPLPDATAISVSPLASLPAGAEFGTLVHEVLEGVDFRSGDLRADLVEVIDHRSKFGSLDLRPVSPADATSVDGLRLLAEGLETAINSPLGPLFHNGRLADIHRSDRLDEMTFELLLAEGSNRESVLPSDRDIGRLVHDHLPADDLLRDWAASVADGIFGVNLAGHLTGSIDALFRVGGSDDTQRFVVVDYKSNRLHDPGAPPRPGDYSQSGMAAAMAQHHYGLQALLYSVAVHRYLQWRLPDYSPDINLGGIAYLFVRGMTGTGTGTGTGKDLPDGVFTWQPPAQLIVDLSDLLSRPAPSAIDPAPRS